MTTKQQTFDTVVNGLREQGCKSIEARENKATGKITGFCKYRDNQGNKCAIGQLISDEEYDASLEGMPILHAKTNLNLSLIRNAINVVEIV